MDTYSIIACIALAVILLIIIPGYLAATRQWSRLHAYALELILKAEQTIQGSKQGQERFEQVMAWLYETVIPKSLKFLFPQTLVRKKLQEWFESVKSYLEHYDRKEAV